MTIYTNTKPVTFNARSASTVWKNLFLGALIALFAIVGMASVFVSPASAQENASSDVPVAADVVEDVSATDTAEASDSGITTRAACGEVGHGHLDASDPECLQPWIAMHIQVTGDCALTSLTEPYGSHNWQLTVHNQPTAAEIAFGGGTIANVETSEYVVSFPDGRVFTIELAPEESTQTWDITDLVYSYQPISVTANVTSIEHNGSLTLARPDVMVSVLANNLGAHVQTQADVQAELEAMNATCSEQMKPNCWHDASIKFDDAACQEQCAVQGQGSLFASDPACVGDEITLNVLIINECGADRTAYFENTGNIAQEVELRIDNVRVGQRVTLQPGESFTFDFTDRIDEDGNHMVKYTKYYTQTSGPLAGIVMNENIQFPASNTNCLPDPVCEWDNSIFADDSDCIAPCEWNENILSTDAACFQPCPVDPTVEAGTTACYSAGDMTVTVDCATQSVTVVKEGYPTRINVNSPSGAWLAGTTSMVFDSETIVLDISHLLEEDEEFDFTVVLRDPRNGQGNAIKDTVEVSGTFDCEADYVEPSFDVAIDCASATITVSTNGFPTFVRIDTLDENVAFEEITEDKVYDISEFLTEDEDYELEVTIYDAYNYSSIGGDSKIDSSEFAAMRDCEEPVCEHNNELVASDEGCVEKIADFSVAVDVECGSSESISFANNGTNSPLLVVLYIDGEPTEYTVAEGAVLPIDLSSYLVEDEAVTTSVAYQLFAPSTSNGVETITQTMFVSVDLGSERDCIAPPCEFDESILSTDEACVEPACEFDSSLVASDKACVEPACEFDSSLVASDKDCVEETLITDESEEDTTPEPEEEKEESEEDTPEEDVIPEPEEDVIPEPEEDVTAEPEEENTDEEEVIEEINTTDGAEEEAPVEEEDESELALTGGFHKQMMAYAGVFLATGFLLFLIGRRKREDDIVLWSHSGSIRVN